MIHRCTWTVRTRGRGLIDVTRDLEQAVEDSGVETGLVTVFVHHTSASLIINENADPDVRVDLERFFSRLIPDGDPMYRHSAEGPDDMPAHIRSAVTQTSIGIPVALGRPDLGTWQGLYLWEHRTRGHHRRMSAVVLG